MEKKEELSGRIYNVVLFLWFFWIIYSVGLLLGTSLTLIILYSVYLGFSTFVLMLIRGDVFHPIGLFTVVCFLAFGLNIPLIASGDFVFLGKINDVILVRILLIILTSQIGFICGCFIPLSKYLPLQKIVVSGKRSVKVSGILAIVGVLIVLFAGVVRIKFHLGEAGVQPTIPYAGIVQYILYDGVLIISCWFLAQGLRQGKKYTFLGLVLIVGIAATQVMLGWRGGIIHSVIIVFFIFWYTNLLFQRKRAKIKGALKKPRRSLSRNYRARNIMKSAKKSPKLAVWLMLLFIIVPLFMKQANRIRADKLGGESEYSEGVFNFVEKTVARAQGTTRLASVLMLKSELTLTNDFYILDLIKEGRSITKFVDSEVYGVKEGQSHSVGTSGPGGPYIAAGVVGVFVAYLLLGVLFRGVYVVVLKEYDNFPLVIVWYALFCHALFGALSENFNLNTVKLLFAVSILIFIFSRMVSDATAQDFSRQNIKK